MKKIILASILFFATLAGALAQPAFTVEVIGTGSPIFLLPGFGCPGSVWDETVADLSKKHECHVFTFAGFGGVAPIATPWLSTIKDELIAYTQNKQLSPPTLLGHSLGGTLSLWLASEKPALFGKLILVDALPASAALMIPNYDGTKIPYENPQSSAMLNMDASTFAQMNNQTVSFMCQNREKQRLISEWFSLADRKTYVYGYIDMLNLDLRENLKQIKAPVHILAASLPNLAMAENTYKSQYKNLPSTQVQFAPESAHFVMFDQPQWLIDNVKKLVD